MAGSRRCWRLRGEMSKLPPCGMGSSLRLRFRPFLPAFDPRSNDDAKRHRGVALAYAAGLFPLNSILDRIVALCATGEKDQTACKPGSVRLIAQVWQPFLWDACCQAPHATHPGRGRKTAHARPLFGLAPGGVYRAGPVASPAVGSYPTLSPLPPTRGGGLLSVALSLGLRRAAVSRRPVSLEPGLSSSMPLPACQRLPGRLVWRGI